MDNAGARFPTTHWSDVARAADLDPQVKRDALGRLLTAYLPALRTHLVTHKRIAMDRAEDLVQGFACDRVVADDLIARADRARGRLRTFILVALDRYAAAVHRRECAAVRSPGTLLLPIEVNEPVADEGVADVFDFAWAQQVMQGAIEQMRDTCAADARGRQVWQVFETCTLSPLLNGTEPAPHRETMRRFGYHSEQQVSNTLVTAKRLLSRILRGIVGDYARDPDEVEAEMRDLWSILARGGDTTDARHQVRP